MKKLLLKNKGYVLVILLLIIIEPSINSVLNFWLQKLFNSAKLDSPVLPVIRLLTTGFLLWILKRAVSFASGVIKSRYICRAKQDLKRDVFASLLGKDTANIAAIASSGEYISVFTNDINLIEQRFFSHVVGLVSAIVSVVILGASFFALNAKLTAAILVFGVIAMIVPAIFAHNLNKKNLEYSNAVSRFTQALKEYIIAYPTIKNLAIEHQITERFNAINEATEESKFESDYALQLANSVGQLLSWFMQFIAVGLGLVLVIKGEIMIGTVIAAQGFAGDLASPLQSIILCINSIRSVKEIVKKVETLTDNADESGEASEAPAALPATDTATPEIVFDKLSLTLGSAHIINDFSFRFEPGKKYLIVGMNGSGKSSVFKTLKRWYHCQQGSITIGGRNVSDFDTEELSRVVSYMNENVSLFSGTVRDNITLFRTCLPEHFTQAVHDAQVELALDREIADEGRNISSGEQRRIEVARSLLASAKVLIFDEVVSTLDIETAYEIEDMVLSLQDKTIIFISHNFSGKLIRKYDEILVMDHGQLIAHGNYEELRSACPYFDRICSIKFGDI